MDIYNYVVKNRNNEDIKISNYKGKVLLVVNTATGCGFTPQYKALEELYQKYHDDGLEILDFPCDQFGHQAPGSDEEIHEFCTSRYQTSFDQLKKIEVNGDRADLFFEYVKMHAPAERVSSLKHLVVMKGVLKMSRTYKNKFDIGWNFTKFLIDRKGNIVARYAPTEDPMSMEDDIRKALK